MKKIIWMLIVITLIVVGYFFSPNIFKNTSVANNKPEIVELFACGDYCPGPREKYVVQVYKDVKTAEECVKIGGEFSSFTGWTTVYFCKVK